MIRVLLIAATLATTPAAFAQTAPTPATPPAEAPAAPAPGEAEFEAKAEAFGTRMQGMAEEMQTAITEAAGDAAKQDADLDAIEARYQTDVDTFAADLEAFVGQQAAAAPADQRAGMMSGVAAALPQIRAIPGQVRTQVEAAAMAPAAAPAPAQ